MAYDDTQVVEYLRKTHDTRVLSDREKHLVGLAVTVTRGCQVCTRNRIQKARAAGIGDEVLNALVGIVSAVNAGVSAATAREGFRMADEALQDACGDLCSAEVAAKR
jgi:alkylhydroperoxidase/carboxymuconolactone decarboxylase family protein YurZ